ncbi:hypothetical protein TNCV_709601 [Trichonephila clavipes]|nr:hypothetical protein TNCV_709601 [Trichonephila clavipes]
MAFEPSTDLTYVVPLHNGIRDHYDQLSEFERVRITGLKEGDCAKRIIAGQMDQSVMKVVIGLGKKQIGRTD